MSLEAEDEDAEEVGRLVRERGVSVAQAAEAAGVKTQVGFNDLCNSMLALAREMITAGELREIRRYRGMHCEG